MNRGCSLRALRRDASVATKGGKEMINPGEESNIPRRTFCNRLMLTSAGLALAAGSLKGQTKDEPGNALFYPPVKIEGAERVLPGSFLYFNYPRENDPAVLVRAQDGEYLAYSRKCAHLGCSVDFDRARRCLACPCHQGVYDARTGYVVYGPPPRPLDQIVLQMHAGGELWAIGRRSGGNLNAERPNIKQRDG
jgi:Rieske Fe-S protein